MATLLDENPYWPTVGGKPIVNGYIYIGDDGEDPENNPKDIFSDESLETALRNPQRTGADGRSENKIYLDGKYSIRISDSTDSQVFQDLNRGSVTVITGPIGLENVEGINAITAEAVNGPITSYVDQQEYVLTLVSTPTDAMTLDIDGIGVVNVVNGNQYAANDVVAFIYNESENVFQASTPGIFENEGADVASATQPNIWVPDGNTRHMTGTDPITTFADAPRIGARVTVIFDEAGVIITHGSGITLQGAADITTEAGDTFEVYADALDAFSGVYIRKSGFPLFSVFGNKLLHIEDLKTDTASGGTFTSGSFQTRDLNTIRTNEIAGSSLSSNAITLPVGVYWIVARAPAYQVNQHQIRIANTSGSNVDITGERGAATAAGVTTHVVAEGRATLTEETVIELTHICQTTVATTGFGVGSVSFGIGNIYSSIKIWKVG